MGDEAAWSEVKPEDAAAYRNLKEDATGRESQIEQMKESHEVEIVDIKKSHEAEIKKMKNEGASLGDISLRQGDMSTQISEVEAAHQAEMKDIRTEHARTQGEMNAMVKENESLGKAAGLDDSLAQSEEAMDKAKKTMDNKQASMAKLNETVKMQQAEYGRSLHYMAGMAGSLSPAVADAVLSEKTIWNALQKDKAGYHAKSLVSDYTREATILDQGANQPGGSAGRNGGKDEPDAEDDNPKL